MYENFHPPPARYPRDDHGEGHRSKRRSRAFPAWIRTITGTATGYLSCDRRENFEMSTLESLFLGFTERMVGKLFPFFWRMFFDSALYELLQRKPLRRERVGRVTQKQLL